MRATELQEIEDKVARTRNRLNRAVAEVRRAADDAVAVASRLEAYLIRREREATGG